MVGLALLCALGCGEEEVDTGVDAGTSCEGPGFVYAPAPTALAGDLVVVAIDVVSVDGKLTFDMAAESARGQATLTFELGDVAGHAAFDLHQVIDYVELNGEALAVDDVARQIFSPELPNHGLRVISVELEACTSNELYLEYQVTRPAPAPAARAPRWEEGSLWWGFDHSDRFPGRYVEQWLPVYLLHDEFALTVDVELDNATVDHTLIANGEIDELDSGSWRVSYPSHFTSLSPMLLIAPTAELEHGVTPVELGVAGSLDVDIYRELNAPQELEEITATLTAAVSEFVADDGPYWHGERVLAYVWAVSSGMEYDGAFTSAATERTLRHELYHSWFGRGLKPASHNHGWFDESWTVYRLNPPDEPLAADAPALELSSADPWRRAVPDECYVEGAALMMALADLVGEARFAELIRTFYARHPRGVMTTEELERFLYCESGEVAVRFWFNRFVYGSDEPPAPLPPGYCPLPW